MTESMRRDTVLGVVSPEGFQIASGWAGPVTCRLSEPPKLSPAGEDRPRTTGLLLFELAVRT